jgi:NTE family protein
MRGIRYVNLALQGGGAHGAFTWGVLDRLLEEPSLAIDGISATSAGAVNAVVLAHGLTVGGRYCAKKALFDFWHRTAEMGTASFLQAFWYDRLTRNHSLEHSPGYFFFDLLSRMLSPYQFNPFNFNPLRSVLEEIIDFECLRSECVVKLFCCATNVRTGKARVFTNSEISVACVLASACLPNLYQAVEIEGEHFWDGGYIGNPALFPLIYNCEARDIVIVHVNPIERRDVPMTAPDILSRINEISFNSSTLCRYVRNFQSVLSLLFTLSSRMTSSASIAWINIRFRPPLPTEFSSMSFVTNAIARISLTSGQAGRKSAVH